jgi:hypothetical protein
MRVSGCAILTVTVGNVDQKSSIRGHRGGNRRMENTTGRGASGFVLKCMGFGVIKRRRVKLGGGGNGRGERNARFWGRKYVGTTYFIIRVWKLGN